MHGNYDGQDATRKPFKLIHISELDEHEPEPEALVQRLLPRTGFATIYGAPGSGKTFFALHLGLCVASGLPFFGNTSEPVAVVYIAAEAGSGIKKRVIAARDRLNITDAEFYIITEAPNLGFATPNDANRLIFDIQNARIPNLGLIFIDTVARCIPGTDENNSMHMGSFVATADRLARHFNCLVVGVHHAGKDQERGMRGSSALNGATDAEWSIRCENGVHTARLEKMREGEANLSMDFALEVHEFADETSTCVVQELTQPELRKHTAKPWQATGATAIALDALIEVLNDRGSVPPSNNYIPDRVRTVNVNVWKAHAAKRGLSTSDDPNSLNKAFQRTLQKLLENKKIGTWNEHVWLVVG
ncbi:hypothetical protein LPJGGPFB_05653 [Ensifer adhaerens]|uniref:AAA family ATPase n=1 Tax=Ensifer adhaerens TaxID=106592 RepID=UPI001569C6FE|nr:AAA family ATPase [Ensifer adhaerens]NRP22394.1 hypothetical protein [Ensifer adhaerens]